MITDFEEAVRITEPDGKVTPGTPVVFTVDVRNTTPVVDAYRVTVLGIDHAAVNVQPEFLPLFPDERGTVRVEITLPDTFPSGTWNPQVQVSSRSLLSVVAIRSLRLEVVGRPMPGLHIDPESLAGRRSGRFGLTLHNTGNAPLEIRLSGNDQENHFAFAFKPAESLVLAGGETRSVQLVVSGRRSFTGTPVPRQFTIIAESPGRDPLVKPGSFTQQPFVSRMALMLGFVLAIMALWALVVGGAISSVIGDVHSDVAKSVEVGVGGVADRLAGESGAAGQLDAARRDLLAAAQAPAVANGTSGTGVQVGTGPSGPSGTSGSAAPPDALIGVVVAASDGRRVPGAIMSVKALLTPNGLADPNRTPVTAASDADGKYQMLEMIPGPYAATFSAPGYREVSCRLVTIPTSAAAPLGPCTTDTGEAVVPVEPGAQSTVRLLAQQASIAGIITKDSAPLAGALVEVFRLDATTGAPSPIPNVEADTTESGDGRFSFVFEPGANATPGTFEVVVSAPDFVGDRVVVALAAGQKVVGLEIQLHPVVLPPAARAIAGTVTDASNAALLANVTVRVTGLGATFELSTLANGRYYLEGLTPGRYNVAFAKAGFEPTATEVVVPVAAASNSAIALKPVLVAARGVVTGQMARDADRQTLATLDSVPLAGAEIRDASGHVVARSDATGSWMSAPAFSGGPVSLTVSAPGFLPQSFAVAVAPPATGIVPPIVLIARDAWITPIGTPISPNLLNASLECDASGRFVASTRALRVTAVQWHAAVGSSVLDPPATARVETAADGSTVLAFSDVPRQGSLEIAFGDGPSGLYATSLVLHDLSAPPTSATIGFAGPGWLQDSVDVPVSGFVVGDLCPSLQSGTAPLSGVGRSFVVRDTSAGRPRFLVDQLQLGIAVAVAAPGSSRTGTPNPGGTFR